MTDPDKPIEQVLADIAAKVPAEEWPKESATARRIAALLEAAEKARSREMNSDAFYVIEDIPWITGYVVRLREHLKRMAGNYHMKRLVARYWEKAARVTKIEWDAAESRAAALEAENGRLRKALDATPKTADGVPITMGMTVYFECPDYEYWGIDPGGDEPAIVSDTVGGMSIPISFEEYQGTANIWVQDASWEGGNLDCYSTEEAARKALERKEP